VVYNARRIDHQGPSTDRLRACQHWLLRSEAISKAFERLYCDPLVVNLNIDKIERAIALGT
jgi:hypothetical protein